MYDYQPLKVHQILEEAGWKDSNGDGILDKNTGEGFVDLSFTVNAHMDNIMQKETLNLIVEQLKDVGLMLSPDSYPG